MENFENLTPDFIFAAVEEALGEKMTGFMTTFTSYINRVFELETAGGERVIAKFYRPGRWHYDALCDEHDFLFDCQAAELPVIAPKILHNGSSIGDHNGIFFAVFPKMSGRQFELKTDQDWVKTGRLLGRLHSIGENEIAPDRIELHPDTSLVDDINYLLDYIPEHFVKTFKEITDELLTISTPLFEDIHGIRIHGDAHLSNFIDRLDGNVYMIDFDDMMMGPAVQDFWLILPNHLNKSKRELELLISGYEFFRPFDRRELKLVEPLRMMRMIYFTAWCASQKDDFKFQHNFPNWGTDSFWRKELKDLTDQLQIIKTTL